MAPWLNFQPEPHFSNMTFLRTKSLTRPPERAETIPRGISTPRSRVRSLLCQAANKKKGKKAKPTGEKIDQENHGAYGNASWAMRPFFASVPRRHARDRVIYVPLRNSQSCKISRQAVNCTEVLLKPQRQQALVSPHLWQCCSPPLDCRHLARHPSSCAPVGFSLTFLPKDLHLFLSVTSGYPPRLIVFSAYYPCIVLGSLKYR